MEKKANGFVYDKMTRLNDIKGNSNYKKNLLLENM
jgi:hypothetical protein